MNIVKYIHFLIISSRFKVCVLYAFVTLNLFNDNLEQKIHQTKCIKYVIVAGPMANREVVQALNTLAHFNNMTNGSLFGGGGYNQVSP